MSFDELPEMLTVAEMATVLRIGRTMAYEAVSQFEDTDGRDGIPCVRIGRCLRVPKRDLISWIGAGGRYPGTSGSTRST